MAHVQCGFLVLSVSLAAFALGRSAYFDRKARDAARRAAEWDKIAEAWRRVREARERAGRLGAIPGGVDFDPVLGVLTLYGLRYDLAIFEHLGIAPVGTVLRIVERREGVVTVERVEGVTPSTDTPPSVCG